MSGITAPLGQELRRLREQAGLSQRELSTRLGWHGNANLSRYEAGKVRPSPDSLGQILDQLQVEPGERRALMEQAHRAYGPGQLVTGVPSTARQLAQLIGYERSAARITDVAPNVVPGLLQTADYARAAIGEGPDLDRRVRLRMERAEILTRAEDPVELRVIVHMEVLTRPVAAAAVMREQLDHLRRMADLPNISIQVVQDYHPWWVPILASPFIVIEFRDTSPIVHIEHYRGAVFVWEDEDVRGFMAVANQIAQKAMTPARSAEVIAEIARSQT